MMPDSAELPHKGSFSISFGALAPPMIKQLREQHIRVENKTRGLQVFEEDAKSIVKLLIDGLLTYSEARRARQRLMKKLRLFLESKTKC